MCTDVMACATHFSVNNSADTFDDEFKITERLVKAEALNLKQEQHASKLLTLYINSVEHYEKACKDKLNRLKNEVNTTKSKINDTKLIRKNMKKEKKIIVQTKQNLEMNLAQVQEDVSSLEARKKELELKVESLQKGLLEKCYAHDKANNIFQEKLQCYIEVNDVEGPTVTMYLLNSKKADNYFAKLQNDKGHWSLLQVTPELDSLSELKKQLQETGDIQGCLCSIRSQFKKLQVKK